MNYIDYMKEYHGERYGTEDYGSDNQLRSNMGKDFEIWMNFKLIEQLKELNNNLKERVK